MRYLWHIIRNLWQTAPPCRVAIGYLSLLLLLMLALPWLPLHYGPNELDLDQVYKAPFQWTNHQTSNPRHWLGTDGLGRDLLANVLYGTRTAFAVSLPVMLLATLIGLFLGAAAGMYGNRRMTLSRGRLVALLLALPFVFYYAVYVPLLLSAPHPTQSDYLLTAILAIVLPALLLIVLPLLLNRAAFFRKRAPFPVDELLLRLIEVQTSIPRLVLILVLAAIFPPSLAALSLLLILTFWTGTARLARAEMLRIRELPFFEAAISLGLTKARLLVHHALPHLIGPVLVAFTFGLASLLMLESTLSFLNIGVSTELVSLGRMVAGIRANTSAWWLVVIPGAVLSATVLALQTCSYYLLRALQQKK